MDTPLPLKAAALSLTGFACVAAWNGSDPYWPLLLFPLLALGLARRSRAAFLAALALSFGMAAFGALIAWKGAQRGSPAWFLEHFRWTALFWLGLASLLGARSSRRAVARA